MFGLNPTDHPLREVGSVARAVSREDFLLPSLSEDALLHCSGPPAHLEPDLLLPPPQHPDFFFCSACCCAAAGCCCVSLMKLVPRWLSSSSLSSCVNRSSQSITRKLVHLRSGRDGSRSAGRNASSEFGTPPARSLLFLPTSRRSGLGSHLWRTTALLHRGLLCSHPCLRSCQSGK